MEYHKERFEDHSLLIYKKKELIGLLPANRVGISLRSHQGLTYGGLLLGNLIRFEDVLLGFRALLKYLDHQKFTELRIKSIPSIYHHAASDELDYLMFICGAEMFKRDMLSVVNPKVLKYSRSRKEGVRRGNSYNLTVKETDDFSSFWKDILIPNLRDKHKISPVHSLEEISKLKLNFPSNIRQFNVYQNEELVGGTTIFESENVAHVQYISGNRDKNQLGSLDFLFAYIIENIYQEKCFVDFGISNENNGQNINSGLLFWKEGFGARSIIHDFYKLKPSSYVELDNLML